MNTDTQLKVQAYLDNELSPGDARKVAALISSDKAVHDLFMELQQTRQILAGNEPEVRVQDSREFYWSQIQRRIQSAEATASRQPAQIPWWRKMLVPMAGAAALLAVLLSISQPGNAPQVATNATSAGALASSPIQTIENSPEVSTITFRSESEGVTVVWVSSSE